MVALAPQIFNDDSYCGDFADFDLANKSGSLEGFLKLELTKTECLSEPIDKDPVSVRVDPLMVILVFFKMDARFQNVTLQTVRTEAEYTGGEIKSVDVEENVADLTSYEQIEAFESLADDPAIGRIK